MILLRMKQIARAASSVAVFLGAVFAGHLGGVTPAAAGIISNGQNRELATRLFDGPIDFYVATGPADSCGPRCNKWIAAEGKFDSGAKARFEAFLAAPGRRDLPVFFQSGGGILSQGIGIAQMLRRYHMRAGVGQTIIPGCTPQRRSGGNCDKLVKSSKPVSATLQTNGGQCHSACVFALAGAAIRTIAPGALIGIHSPRTDAVAWKKYADTHPDAKRLTNEERQLGLWRFILTLGIDPALVELAGTVSPRSLYILSREEVARFGLQSGGQFETRWLPRDPADGRFEVIKAVTPADGDRSTMLFQLTCPGAVGYQLTVFSALSTEGAWLPSSGTFSAGNTSITMTGGKIANSEAFWTAVSAFDPLQQIAAAGEAQFGIVFSGGDPPRQVRLSTEGLLEGVSELQKKCTMRRVTAASGRRAK
jgi:hypothetical protein